MKDVLKRLRGFVQMVSDIVIDDDGNATCTGVGDDQEEDSYSPTVAYHFGFYSRPKDGARGVILKADGRGNTSFLIGFRDKQYELTLQKGEVGMQNAFGASILLDKNGVANINGSDYWLLRTDAFLTDLATCITAINTAVYTTGSLVATNPPDITGFLTKLGAGNYKSTKAKNG